jgi:hypothetical protein
MLLAEGGSHQSARRAEQIDGPGRVRLMPTAQAVRTIPHG